MLDEVDILEWLDKTDPVMPAISKTSAHTDTLTGNDSNGTSFEIQREVLLSLLEKAITVVPTNDMVPVYTNFQFTLGEDSLVVTATSEFRTIVVSTTQVDTKVAGVEVFPARTLLNIVRETSAGSTIFIEATELGAVIVSGGFGAEVKMTSGTGFPRMESIDDVAFHEVDRKSFINAVVGVRYALPGREFAGQAGLKMINIKGGKFTACDGERFQQTRIDGFRLNMKLPSDNIALLVKLFTASDIEMLEIGELDSKLVFRLGNLALYLNKMNDPYPNVEQLWLRPALSNNQELVVNRNELLTAIKQVKTAASTESSAIGIIIDNDSMRIVAKEIERNSAHATIPCKWSGKPRNVVVNFKHLAEMLKAYPLTECKFMLDDDTKTHKPPILLKDDETMSIATISQLLAFRAGLV